MILLKEPPKEKALLTLHVITETQFSLWDSQKIRHVCDAMTFLLDNIVYDLTLNCIDKLQGFQWALIVLPLWCYNKKDFMMSLSNYKQADTIATFNTIPGYLDDINNIYVDNMLSKI